MIDTGLFSLGVKMIDPCLDFGPILLDFILKIYLTKSSSELISSIQPFDDNWKRIVLKIHIR